MITYTLCTFRVKSNDYLTKLHEFYKACKSLGMLPHNSAIVIRGDLSSIVTGIELSKKYSIPRREQRVQVGDVILLLVGQLYTEEVKL